MLLYGQSKTCEIKVNIGLWPARDSETKVNTWRCVTLDTVAIVAPGVQRLVVLCS